MAVIVFAKKNKTSYLSYKDRLGILQRPGLTMTPDIFLGKNNMKNQQEAITLA